MRLSAKKLSVLRALAAKKGRRKHGAFLASGIRVIDEAAKSGQPIQFVAVAPVELTSHGRDFLEKLAGVEIFEISAKDVRRIDESDSSQGIIAVIEERASTDGYRKLQSASALALDSVSDPSNLGAIIRSAVAFRFEDILLGRGCAELHSPKVIRASAGMVFHVNPMVDVELHEEMPRLKSMGYRVIGTDAEGTSLETAAGMTSRPCLVVGNEAHGISPAAGAWCDDIVRIPISDVCESLSAPAAAAIAMYELSKRRGARSNMRNIDQQES